MGILLFNWYGYRLVSEWLEHRSDRQMEAMIDQDEYDPGQLVTIKVAATRLSYYNTSTTFERAEGQITVAGIRYKYVERRLYNDSLELRCIPDQGTMRLETARNDFFKMVNDLQQHNSSGKKAGSHSMQKNIGFQDYYPVTSLSITVHLSYVPRSNSVTPAPAVVSSFHTITEQPPDFSATV